MSEEDTFREEMRELKKESKETEIQSKIDRWREYWRNAGPIRFAEEVLLCPLDVPAHPDFDPQNNPKKWCEGCQKEHPKFRFNGVPYHIILSDEQKEFLTDLWASEWNCFIVSAARGAGKTFIMAVYNCWRTACFDKYPITYMGGSQEQSELCQEYIDDWRVDVPMLRAILIRSIHGVKPKIISSYKTRLVFSACSPPAARGKHVREVHIDEACTAESKSVDGARAVAAAWWQITGKRHTKLILLSTSNFVYGKFYEYLTDAQKYGFKAYQWATVKHVSGKPAELTYKDRNPDNWRPNVWWMTQENIRILRKNKNDEEWLCEALGGASMLAGNLFSKDDMNIAICSQCEICEPYVWGKCKLLEHFQLGTEENPLCYLEEKSSGADFGETAPNALTIIGRKGKMVFVLFNDEIIELREETVINWIFHYCKKLRVYEITPDPSRASYRLKLEEKGLAVNIVDPNEKDEWIGNVKKLMERHLLIIPKRFINLIRSLKKVTYDERGNIRKVDDHSFDSLLYACIFISIDEGEGGFWEAIKEHEEEKKRNEENPTRIW